MLAVSANRTRVHFGQVHFCRTHNCVVDKTHIDSCNILNSADTKVTQFNNLLANTYLYDIAKENLERIYKHFTNLKQVILKQEQEGTFVSIDRKFVNKK